MRHDRANSNHRANECGCNLRAFVRSIGHGRLPCFFSLQFSPAGLALTKPHARPHRADFTKPRGQFYLNPAGAQMRPDGRYGRRDALRDPRLTGHEKTAKTRTDTSERQSRSTPCSTSGRACYDSQNKLTTVELRCAFRFFLAPRGGGKQPSAGATGLVRWFDAACDQARGVRAKRKPPQRASWPRGVSTGCSCPVQRIVWAGS